MKARSLDRVVIAMAESMHACVRAMCRRISDIQPCVWCQLLVNDSPS